MIYVKEVTGLHAPMRINGESNFEDLLYLFCCGRAYTRRETFEDFLTPRFRGLFNSHEDIAQQMRDSSESCIVRLSEQFDAENSAEAARLAVEGMLESVANGAEV